MCLDNHLQVSTCKTLNIISSYLNLLFIIGMNFVSANGVSVFSKRVVSPAIATRIIALPNINGGAKRFTNCNSKSKVEQEDRLVMAFWRCVNALCFIPFLLFITCLGNILFLFCNVPLLINVNYKNYICSRFNFFTRFDTSPIWMSNLVYSIYILPVY